MHSRNRVQRVVGKKTMSRLGGCFSGRSRSEADVSATTVVAGISVWTGIELK